MRGLLLAVSLLTALSGCTGDGGFNVTGTVKSSSGVALSDCKLRLGVRNPALEDYYTREFVDPLITGRFIVAPSKADYPLSVTCAGHEPRQLTISYGTDVSPDRPANLGVIVLQPSTTDGT